MSFRHRVLAVVILVSHISQSAGQSSCNSLQCETITTPQCMSQAYTKTGFQNYFNHHSQKAAAEFANYVDIFEASGCSSVSREFICGLLFPECRETSGLVYPDRNTCTSFYAGCEDILRATGNSELIFNCVNFDVNPLPICPAQPVISPTEGSPVTSAPSVDEGDFLIVVDSSSILTGPLSTMSLAPIPLQDVRSPAAIDYDPIGEMLYWTDTTQNTISRARLDGTRQTVVVPLSLRSDARGIAVDVENKQIYWTDTGSDTIEGANLDGSNRHIIINETLYDPVAIVLDPADRHMFWIDLGSNKIDRANFDGSDRTNLVKTNIRSPVGLAIDSAEKRLYWADSVLATIESSDLDGNGRKVILSTSIQVFQPFDVGFHRKFAYWTDRNLRRIVKTSQEGRAEVVGPELLLPGGFYIQEGGKPRTPTPCGISCEPIAISQCTSQSYQATGFHNYFNHRHQAYAAQFANFVDLFEAYNCYANAKTFICGLLVPECRENEGLVRPNRQLCMDFYAGCRSILIETGNSGLVFDCTEFAWTPKPVCYNPPPVLSTEEPITMPPIADNEAFALVTDLSAGRILIGGLAEMDLTPLPFLALSSPSGIDYDPQEDMIYWTDTGRRTVNRGRIDGTAQQVLVTLAPTSMPTSLALDVKNRRIYWTDRGERTIERTNLDGTNRRGIITDQNVEPRSIVVDSSRGYLYWIDTGTTKRIARSDLVGNNIRTLVNANIQSLTGLTIDYQEQRLYWCDAGLSRIESSDFDGQNRKIVFSIYPVTDVMDPFDVAVFKGYAFWTDWRLNRVLRTDNMDNVAVVGPALTRPGGLHIQLDIEKPILDCPVIEEQWLVTDELSKLVSWPEPTYSDNSGLLGDMTSTQTSPSVFGIGVHRVSYQAWDPYGNTERCTITITVTATCPEDLATVNSVTLLWLQTPALDQEVGSDKRCDVNTANRGDPLAKRVCMRDVLKGAIWLEPVYIGCGESDDVALQDLPETPVIASNVENVAEALTNITQEQIKEDQPLTTEDVQDISETFRNIIDVESAEPEVTVAVIELVDNLVVLTEQTETKQVDQTSAEYYLDIALGIEQQVSRATASGQNITTVEPNIALTITTVKPNQPLGISLAVRDTSEANFQEGDVKIYSDPNNLPPERRTAVILPSVIFNTTNDDKIGVSFVVHNNDVLFPTPSTENQTVGSDIVSAIVTGVERIDNLPEPVVLEFTVTGDVTGKNSSCVFWDFEISNWSPEGCQFVETRDNRTICHCNHLTNFAVLVDADYDTDTHVILDYISMIGCGISMLALLITLFIFIKFRRLRLDNKAIPRQILINLCVALFCLYFIFLVGIDQHSHRNGCICVAFLLQFFALASIMWMGVEAFNLYLMIVWPFKSHPRNFVIKVAVIAWGLPLVISAISLGAGVSYYEHLKYCFVTGPPLYYGVILPIATVMLVNIVIFAVVTHRLCTSNVNGQKSEREKNIQRLKNAFVMSILIGVAWIFGFFAIEDAAFVMSLLFCLFNSFQGLVLFLLFCARQEDVKHVLKPYLNRVLCCRGAIPNLPRKSDKSQITGSTGESSRQQPYSNADFEATIPMTGMTPRDDIEGSYANSTRDPYMDLQKPGQNRPNTSEPYTDLKVHSNSPETPLTPYENTPQSSGSKEKPYINTGFESEEKLSYEPIGTGGDTKRKDERESSGSTYATIPALVSHPCSHNEHVNKGANPSPSGDIPGYGNVGNDRVSTYASIGEPGKQGNEPPTLPKRELKTDTNGSQDYMEPTRSSPDVAPKDKYGYATVPRKSVYAPSNTSADGGINNNGHVEDNAKKEKELRDDDEDLESDYVVPKLLRDQIRKDAQNLQPVPENIEPESKGSETLADSSVKPSEMPSSEADSEDQNLIQI